MIILVMIFVVKHFPNQIARSFVVVHDGTALMSIVLQ